MSKREVYFKYVIQEIQLKLALKIGRKCQVAVLKSDRKGQVLLYKKKKLSRKELYIEIVLVSLVYHVPVAACIFNVFLLYEALLIGLLSINKLPTQPKSIRNINTT